LRHLPQWAFSGLWPRSPYDTRISFFRQAALPPPVISSDLPLSPEHSKQACVALACPNLQTSKACYRYERKFSNEKPQIFHALMRSTASYKA